MTTGSSESSASSPKVVETKEVDEEEGTGGVGLNSWLQKMSFAGTGKTWEEVVEATQTKLSDARAASLEAMSEAKAKSIELASTANKFGDTLAARVKEKLALEDQTDLESGERRKDTNDENEERSALLSGWSLDDLSSRFSEKTIEVGAGVKTAVGRLNENTSQFSQSLAASVGENSLKVKANVRGMASDVATGFSSQIADTRECGLTRPQRFRYYVALLLASTFFFGLAFQFIFIPSKFATAFSFGTICSLAAKAMLNGPYTQLRLMFAIHRLPYTFALLATTGLTLYLTFIRANFFFTLAAALANVAALLYYLFADTPGGKHGIRLLFKFILNTLRLFAKPFMYAFE